MQWLMKLGFSKPSFLYCLFAIYNEKKVQIYPPFLAILDHFLAYFGVKTPLFWPQNEYFKKLQGYSTGEMVLTLKSPGK
jgi:hypothetical protein